MTHFIYMYLNLRGDFVMILNLRPWESPWNQIFTKVWGSFSLGELYRNPSWDLEMRIYVLGFSHDGSVVCGIFWLLHTFGQDDTSWNQYGGIFLKNQMLEFSSSLGKWSVLFLFLKFWRMWYLQPRPGGFFAMTSVYILHLKWTMWLTLCNLVFYLWNHLNDLSVTQIHNITE